MNQIRNLFRFMVVLAAFYALGGQSLLAASGDDGTIIQREAYTYLPYEEAPWLAKYYSKEKYERVVADGKFRFEKLIYLSDGLRVVAYLYTPKEIKGKRYPAIVFNRGSYVVGDIGSALAPLFHHLASEGFVVLAPLYRGSVGGEGRDEMGGEDLNDLMNVLPLLRALEFIDMENLFMYGESRGGMMTYQAIRDGFPLRAAAVFGAFTDLEAMLNSDPRYQQMAHTIWPEFETKREEIVKRRSAVLWAERVNVPILIMHGGADSQIDPSQSLRMAQQLQQLGKTYELVIYGGDTHILSCNQGDRDKKTVAWFIKFMQE